MGNLVQPKPPIYYGYIKIDNITFGNPNQKCLELLKKKSFAEDEIIPLINKRPFYPNFHQKVIEELNGIVAAIKANTKQDNEENLKFNTEPLDAIFIEYCEKNELKCDKELFASVLTDFMPLITKLKYFYNRPRPYQLANYFNIPLYPFISSSSPSYPSKNALISYLLTKIIFSKNNITVEKEKEKAEQITKYFNKICESSICLGIHYPSDIRFSILIGKNITENKKFIDKYLK